MRRWIFTFVCWTPLFLGLSGFSSYAAAEDVELPEEELAKESVLPRFENSMSVKSRNVTLDGKFEIAPYLGFNLTEAIFNQTKLGIILGYHLNEDHAVSVNLVSFLTGLSQYGGQLRNQFGLLFEERAPRPQYGIWGNWEINSYYGKISLSKESVINLSIYPIFGAGMTAYTHKSFFAVSGGVGIKMYFSPTWALRTDLKVQYGQQTEPFLNGAMLSGQPAPQHSQFPEKSVLGTNIDIGFAWLL
jgi:outer membrane beta-barrel protein